MPVSRAVRAAAAGFGGWSKVHGKHVGLGRRNGRAWLLLHAGLWQLAGVLGRTGAAENPETQDLKPGDDS